MNNKRGTNDYEKIKYIVIEMLAYGPRKLSTITCDDLRVENLYAEYSDLEQLKKDLEIISIEYQGQTWWLKASDFERLYREGYLWSPEC